MRDKFYLGRIEAFVFNNYYFFVIIGYLINVFTGFRPGVFIMFLNCILLLCSMSRCFKKRKMKWNTVTLFILIQILSFIMFLMQDSGIYVYFQSFIYLVTPCACYFSLSNLECKSSSFFKSFVLAITINCLFGIPCFYLKPSFFVSYVTRTSVFHIDQVLHIAGLGRLITLFGSIETGVLSAIVVIISLFMLEKENKKLYKFALVINLVAVVLSQQRGALFSVILFILYIIIHPFEGKKRIIKFSTILGIAIGIGVTFLLLSIYKPEIVVWMTDKMKNPFDAITQRYDYQWRVVTTDTNIMEWLFGKGLGSLGFFVEINDIYHRIFDNMYFNIIGEVGLIGFLIFIIIIFTCFKRFAKNTLINGPFIAAIFVVAFQGLGTTLIYYPQIMAVFWFSVGHFYNCAKEIQIYED